MKSPDQRTDREIMERGEQALAILDGPLFTEVIASLRQSLFDQIEASQPEEYEKRQDCYFQLRALNGLRGTLRNIKTRGEKMRDKVTN